MNIDVDAVIRYWAYLDELLSPVSVEILFKLNFVLLTFSSLIFKINLIFYDCRYVTVLVSFLLSCCAFFDFGKVKYVLYVGKDFQ